MANPTGVMEAIIHRSCAYVLVAIHVSKTKETNPSDLHLLKLERGPRDAPTRILWCLPVSLSLLPYFRMKCNSTLVMQLGIPHYSRLRMEGHSGSYPLSLDNMGS